MKLKIVNLKKFVVSIITILTIVLSISLFTGNKVLSRANPEYRIVIVSQGDTLWEIAKSEQQSNEYYKEKDLRYIINDLKSINNLANSNLYNNQKLLVRIS